MEDDVNLALDKRAFVENWANLSIDDKAYTKSHEYASILVDSDA